MDPRDAVMLTIGEEEEGALHGRTLLQKKLYFASVLAGEDFGFRPHYYGPYSQTVADAVDSVVSNGFLMENVESFPAEANLFGEWRRHSYSLTDDGEAVVEAMPETDESAKWREALQKVNSHPVAQDFNLLSVAAKVHVILKEMGKGKAKTSEISRQAQHYGWQLSQHEIEEVGEYLERLGLITRSVPGE